MRTLWLCVVAGLIGVAGANAQVASNAPISVALLPMGAPFATGLVDMMTAADPPSGVRLLDRENVQHVLAEESLIRMEFGADDAVRLGQRFHCDVIAILFAGAYSTNLPIACSVAAFDTRTGARICDEPVLFGDDLADTAPNIWLALGNGLDKCRIGTSRTLSLVSVRVVEWPAMEPFTDAFRSLLEQQLLRGTEFHVLERSRLDVINRETVISEDTRAGLLPSAVLVSVDIMKAVESGASITVTLTTGAGENLGTIISTNSTFHVGQWAVDAADRIAAKLNSTRTDAGALSVRREVEALFGIQGFWQGRHCTNEALAASAAAVALIPRMLAETPAPTLREKRELAILAENVLFQGWLLLLDTHESVDFVIPALEDLIGVIESVDGQMYYNGRNHDELPKRMCMLIRKLQAAGAVTELARMDAVRARYRHVVLQYIEEKVRMSAWQALVLDTGGVGSRMRMELCATNADEVIDWVARYGSAWCGYRLGIWNGSGWQGGMQAGEWMALYDPTQFTAEQKRRLLAVYEAQATNTIYDRLFRFDAYACAIVMANDFPHQITNADDVVARNVRGAYDLGREHPGIVNDMAERLMMGDERVATHRPLQGKYLDMLVAEMKRLAECYEGERRADPDVLMDLEKWDKSGTHPKGWYIQRAAEQIQDRSYTFDIPGNWTDMEWRKEMLKRLQKKYREASGRDLELPEMRSPEVRADAVELLSVARGDHIAGVQRSGNSIYLLLQSGGEQIWSMKYGIYGDKRSRSQGVTRLAMVRVDARTGVVEDLGEFQGHRMFEGISPLDLFVGKRGVHVPTSDGVVTFPLNSEPAQLIGMEEGLPAPRATAVVEIDDDLFIGLRGQEGFLVRCSLSGDDLEILACSGRKEKQGPLDDCPVYDLRHMLVGPSNRWLMVTPLPDKTVVLHLDTMVWTELGAVDLFSPMIRWPRMQEDGRCLMCINPDASNHGQPAGRPWDIFAYRENGGYVLWDPSTVGENPAVEFSDLLWPLMGCYSRTSQREWPIPVFSSEGSLELKEGNLFPVLGSQIAVLDETHLISANDQEWAIIAREDIGEPLKTLPLLGKRSPIWIDVKDGMILAATMTGLWRVTVGAGQRGIGVKSE